MKTAFGVCDSKSTSPFMLHYRYWPESRSSKAVKSYSHGERERKGGGGRERERESARERERDPQAVTAYFQSNRASCGTLEANGLQSAEAPVVPMTS